MVTTRKLLGRPGSPGRFRRSIVLLLLLAVAAVAFALVRYGLTAATLLAALLVVAGAALTAVRSPLGADPPAGDAGRRAVLVGAALTAAAAAGETRGVRVRPEQAAQDEVSLADFADLATDRRDRADPATWDWTPALRAAVGVAARRARHSRRIAGTGAYRRTALPTVRIPRGSYRLTGRVELHYLHGLSVAGDGRQVSVLMFEGDDVLFDVHRSSALTFSGLTINGHDPAVADQDEDVQGLREGSCAFRFVETVRTTPTRAAAAPTWSPSAAWR